MGQMAKLRPLDRAVICRMVYNHDLVPHIPFNALGFEHLDKMVYIPIDGNNICINPHLVEANDFKEVKAVFANFNASEDHPVPEGNKDKSGEGEKTPFELECEKTPEPIKDHMPYW